jgi:hypothetical protein
MGEDEKAAQVGHAVQEYQAAKIECAHIDQKINKVAESYRLVGNAIGFSVAENRQPQIVDGKLKFEFPGVADHQLLLPNEPELTQLLIEREQSRAIRDDAKRRLNDLGIVGLD